MKDNTLLVSEDDTMQEQIIWFENLSMEVCLRLGAKMHLWVK